MDNKILYFDTETTGVDFERCAIIQLSALIEINGDVVDEIDLKIRPNKGDIIQQDALDTHGYSIEDLRGFKLSQKEGHQKITKFMGKYINKFNKADKFVQCGYNVNFDDQMLRGLFNRANDAFYGSWFFWPKIDVASEVAKYIAHTGFRSKDYKLKTLCEHFSIEIKAHDALSDIHATRALYKKLIKENKNA